MLYIELTGVLVNDDGYGLGKYISNDIETGFSIDELEDGVYKSAIDLVELLDENDFYDDDYDGCEEIGIQAFIIKLIWINNHRKLKSYKSNIIIISLMLFQFMVLYFFV